jgi:hypothetical protein
VALQLVQLLGLLVAVVHSMIGVTQVLIDLQDDESFLQTLEPVLAGPVQHCLRLHVDWDRLHLVRQKQAHQKRSLNPRQQFVPLGHHNPRH